MKLACVVLTGAVSAPPTLTAEQCILTIDNNDYALPATLTVSADTAPAEDVEPLTVNQYSGAPADDAIATLTGER